MLDSKIKTVFIIVFLAIAFLGLFYWLFTSDTVSTIYKGQYKNKTIKVKQVETPGFSRSSISYSVQYGNLKPIYIDGHSTDIRGVPYDNIVFKDKKYIYFDTAYDYKNEVEYNEPITITFLYMSNDKFSKDEYLIYEDFFKNDWLRVQKELESVGFSTRIVGLAYGDRNDFIKTFSGTYDNKSYNLTITPDGEINLSVAENSMYLQNSGFLSKVQMPGRILQRIQNEIEYSPNYDDFIDKEGAHLKDYFTIK